MTSKRSTSLRGALVTILISCGLGAMLMAVAAMVMDEALYYIPAVIFVVAAVLGYVFVSKLDAKINGPES
jgi:VIT1/CCC1 family predicted Fe2+/Mn2+ transporter